MVKKYAALAALVLLCSKSFSQNLYFRSSDYSDSSFFQNNFSALAKKLIPLYKEPNKILYYDNLFRLQFLAGDYANGLATLDTAARLVPQDPVDIKGFGFFYRVFYQARLDYSKDSSRPFPVLYQEAFRRFYRPLPPLGTNGLINFALLDSAYFTGPLNAALSRQKASGKDSIGVRDAVALCRAWLALYTRKKSTAGKDLLNQYEREDYISNDSVLIKMPDGGNIALCIVRRRDAAAPLPVVLMYSIYPGFEHSIAREAATNGYVGIVANTRGKRLSPDETEPFEHDAKDAYAIIDWISRQPWCNGKVGMYGGSYLGFAQWSATKYLHPALKTIVPQVAVGIGIDYPMQNGVFMSYMLQWIHYVINNKYTDYPEFSNFKKWDSVNTSWYRSGRSFRALDSIEGRPNAVFQRWLDHPSYDSYWQGMTPQKDEFTKINIPVLTISGYWDDDQLGAMYYFRQHHQWNKNANHYLLIGPYDHGGAQGFPKKVLAGYTLDSAANIPIQKIVFSWFDHVLKDSSLPAILSNKVNFEVMGANKWQHVSSFSEISNDSITFYLGNNSNDKYYPLLPARPSATGFINQAVDFKERTVDSAGDDSEGLIDSTLNSKKNLVFISAPLQHAATFSGSVRISLKLLTNKKDADIVMHLYQQMPDGKYFSLNSSIQRASYSKDRTKRQLLHPGKIETVNLNKNFLTSIQMPEGSRFVLTIGINRSPDWQINYGSGKDVSQETLADAAVPMEVRWYNDSKVIIPILK